MQWVGMHTKANAASCENGSLSDFMLMLVSSDQPRCSNRTASSSVIYTNHVACTRLKFNPKSLTDVKRFSVCVITATWVHLNSNAIWKSALGRNSYWGKVRKKFLNFFLSLRTVAAASKAIYSVLYDMYRFRWLHRHAAAAVIEISVISLVCLLTCGMFQ